MVQHEGSSGVVEQEKDTALAVRGGHVPAPFDPMAPELSVEQVIAQVRKIQRIMKELLHDGEHFGTIPGVTKPSLYKPGAEKLCLMFRLLPTYDTVESWDGDHLTIKSKCSLWHIPSGVKVGYGEGSCSTKESKYAYRYAKRTCPQCSAEAISRSKPEYGGGWYCNMKAGGCNAKFPADASQIVDQPLGRVANPDLADQYNTVLKMANKRSAVAATLGATAASDIFTQDVEDLADGDEEGERRERRQPTTRPELTEEQNETLNDLFQQLNSGGQQRVTKGQVTDSLGTKGYGPTVEWLKQLLKPATPTSGGRPQDQRPAQRPAQGQQEPSRQQPKPSKDGELDFNI